jgi:hypothetical protein
MVSAYIACWGGITLTVTRIAMIEMSVGSGAVQPLMAHRRLWGLAMWQPHADSAII